MEILRTNEFEALRTYRKNSENISEEKAQEILGTILQVQQTRLSLKTELSKSLKHKMSTKKVLALFKAEEDFKRQLLRELRNRRGKNAKN